MSNRMLKVFIAIVFCSLSFQNSYAKKPQIEWGKVQDSHGLEFAKSSFTVAQLPESETELLKDVTISIINGVVVKRVLKVSYLPTFTEAHDEGTEYVYWDDATTDLTITEASVVLPNGVYVRMDPDNLRVRESDEYNTFTNNKEVVIPLSGVTQGSMIVLEYEKRTRLSKLESLYLDAVYPMSFQRDISLFKLTLEHDGSLDFDWHSSASNVPCEYADNKLNCTGTDIKKFPYDQDMLWRDEVPVIVFAQKASWGQVIEHVETAFNKSNYESQEVADYALDLTKDIDDLGDKINALHTFASRSIRYVSMSELGHRITPHKFSDVVKNLFGDCKDKSALLVGMLRAIGVDAFPVLVATKRRNPEKIKIPSSGYFDHMVVCFDLHGKRHCLDPTNTSTNWQSTASWIQGRVAIELRDNAELTTIRLDDYKWVLSSKIMMKYDRHANVKESQTRLFSGVYAGQMRSGFLSYDKKEKDEWLLENYQNNVSTLTEPEFEIKFLDTQSLELKIDSTASFEPYYSNTEDLYFSEYDPWIRTELTSSKVVADNYGVWLDGIHITSEVVYDFGGLWEIIRVPPSLSFNGDVANLNRSVSAVGNNKLKVNTELKIKSRFISLKEVGAHNNMIDVLLRASNIHIEGKLRNK